ncbi:MAG TPA: hypothetical protein VK804_21390 [Bradyrhizobium sp.]|jgi:hypothetical protein|uniref:hypothetical protein n=1 Tax=Bradyrhizobium sp. TaxID=376 RepID=UPI002CAD8AFB|nr:hypothetical protein [Bradyrhizobium sp.]HTB03028.1 hypothetical protein [Bradyrhizobium sp.]
MIKLISAPIRGLIRFPLVQFAIVIAIILWLQAADDKSIFGEIFAGLDKLVESTVEMVSAIFTVKSFTRSWLTFGFMIAYVYLAGSFILWLARLLAIAAIDFAGRHNLFYLRSAIARERGIGAYRAWVPLERIRPDHISQRDWEEAFAWPADNKPPYPPLGHRMLRALLFYAAMIVIAACLLQFLTPFPVLTWIFGWPAPKPS